VSDPHAAGDSPTLLRTPLFPWHASHGGRMVGFGGWEMPIQYRSILSEHTATREAAGLFDVSHMGRLSVRGPAAADWLESLLTRRTHDLRPGGVRYTLLTDDEGSVLDDLLVAREPAERSSAASTHDALRFTLVVNASNRERVVSWLQSRLPSSGASLEDRTIETAMLAVQGPRAVGIVAGLCDSSEEARRLESLRTYAAASIRIAGRPSVASRTGYTGEDGVELVVAADAAERVWDAILAVGGPLGLEPCGLGARDTLRLEAGMPLFGHELVASSDPFALGIGFAVNLEGRRFPGSDRLARLASTSPPRRRVGLIVESGRPARDGSDVLSEGRVVGVVTSGSYSPTLGRPIAMALIDTAVIDTAVTKAADGGTGLMVDVRGRSEPVRIVPLPFVSKKRGGSETVAGGRPFSPVLLFSAAERPDDASGDGLEA
jgi:aminomethyltransferase